MEIVINLSQALDFFMDHPGEYCITPTSVILRCEEDAERYFDLDGSVNNSDIEEDDEAGDLLDTLIAGVDLVSSLIPDSDDSSSSPDTSSTDSGLDSFGGGGDGFDGGGASGDW